jgi:hypothetical protein
MSLKSDTSIHSPSDASRIATKAFSLSPAISVKSNQAYPALSETVSVENLSPNKRELDVLQDGLQYTIKQCHLQQKISHICSECRAIDFEKIMTLTTTELQTANAVIIADLGTRLNSRPINGCALCLFLHSHCRRTQGKTRRY